MKILRITNDPADPNDFEFHFDNGGSVDLFAPWEDEGYSFKMAIHIHEGTPGTPYTSAILAQEILNLKAFQYIWSLCPDANIGIFQDEMLEFILWPTRKDLAYLFNELNLRMSMYINPEKL